MHLLLRKDHQAQAEAEADAEAEMAQTRLFTPWSLAEMRNAQETRFDD